MAQDGNFFKILHLQNNLSLAELVNWQHFPRPSVPGSDFVVRSLLRRSVIINSLFSMSSPTWPD